MRNEYRGYYTRNIEIYSVIIIPKKCVIRTEMLDIVYLRMCNYNSIHGGRERDIIKAFLYVNSFQFYIMFLVVQK